MHISTLVFACLCIWMFLLLVCLVIIALIIIERRRTRVTLPAIDEEALLTSSSSSEPLYARRRMPAPSILELPRRDYERENNNKKKKSSAASPVLEYVINLLTPADTTPSDASTPRLSPFSLMASFTVRRFSFSKSPDHSTTLCFSPPFDSPTCLTPGIHESPNVHLPSILPPTTTTWSVPSKTRGGFSKTLDLPLPKVDKSSLRKDLFSKTMVASLSREVPWSHSLPDIHKNVVINSSCHCSLVPKSGFEAYWSSSLVSASRDPNPVNL